MAESFEANGTPNQNNCSESYNDYLQRAVDACHSGDLVLGMHLYLAAYEKAVVDPSIPDGMALTGLREAWRLACELKERSLAEYVFEKLEPYLTGDEIAACAQQLQTLALDRLEQYGFSREELEEMAEMISQDFVSDGSVVKVESISIPGVGVIGASIPSVAEPSEEASDAPVQPSIATGQTSASQDILDDANSAFAEFGYDDAVSEPQKQGKPNHVNMSKPPVDSFNPYDIYEENSIGTSYYAATNEGAGAHVFTRDKARAEAGRKAKEEAQAAAKNGIAGAAAADDSSQGQPNVTDGQQASDDVGQDAAQAAKAVAQALVSQVMPADSSSQATQNSQQKAVQAQGNSQAATNAQQSSPQVLTYRNLVGYDEVVAVMRDFGVGLQNDRDFLDFVAALNKQHGLSRAPALDTMLFRSAAIEDANRFVEATVGEIGLPVLRMAMEDGVQGMPMLCVTAQGNHRPRMNHAHNRFEAPAILIIDDLDTWVMPSMPENVEGMGGFVMANISRGAREAVNLIRAAVEDPDVYVLATASNSGEVDPFFYEVLEPITVIDIGYPNDKERIDIWTEIAQDHPSMRSISRVDLMRYSEGMARFDIYMAAREAIEEAYKIGLVQRSYVPVTPHNIFEKIAACQPLDSVEYLALEEKVISSFRAELDHLEDLLDGPAE